MPWAPARQAGGRTAPRARGRARPRGGGAVRAGHGAAARPGRGARRAAGSRIVGAAWHAGGVHVVVAPEPDGGGTIRPAGQAATRVPDLAAAVRRLEAAGRPRWVWADTRRVYPQIGRASCRERA